jgi:hypothetical protein
LPPIPWLAPDTVRRFTVCLSLLPIALTGRTASAAAQAGGWPTLAGSGLEYISGSGFAQLTISGQLDLEGIHLQDSWAGLATHAASEGDATDDSCQACHLGAAPPGTGGNLAVHRLRVFADVFLGDHVYSLIEVRSDRGEAPTDGQAEVRVEQAFVRVDVASGAAGIQVGRFASPFGAYAQRHLSVGDPFLTPPLAYDYRTIMSRTLLPGTSAGWVAWKDRPDLFRKPGASPVWGVPYQWGSMAFGSLGIVDVRFAAMNSAPSSGPDQWDLDRDPLDRLSFVGGARVRPTADLDLGLSYSHGAWMGTIVEETVHAANGPVTPGDMSQKTLSMDVTFARGRTVLRAEVMRDQWDVANVGTPTERLYNVEVQRDIWAGVSVAARVGYVDFRPVDAGAAGLVDWDYDVYRYEASLGYRLVRNAGVLVSAYRQSQSVATDGDTQLLGVRLWWGF